jgi:cytochrome P450
MAVVPGTLISPPTGAPLPGPRIPPRELSTLRALWTMRRNVLEIWPAHYYRDLRVHRRLLGREYFLFNDPADIDQLLVAHGERYQREPMARRLLQPMVGRGILLAEGEEWRRQRRTVAPAFQPRHIDRLVPCFHEAAAGMTERWNGDVRQNRRLLGEFRAITLAIAARAMFSIEEAAQTAELGALMDGYERSTSRFGWRDYLVFAGWTGLRQAPDREDFRRRWRGWAASFNESRPAVVDLDAARDLLDLLRAVRDETTGAPLSADEILDQIGTMMAAGFLTTAMALFWIAVMLALHPQYQEAMRAELAGDDPAAPPDPAALRASRLSQAFIYESLRLYPPFFATTRWATADDQIGAMEIRRGSGIIVSPWVLHHHEVHWQAPQRFDPTRFGRDGRLILPKAWMPFGAGPRICIGMAFALTEIAVVLRLLLQRFRISLVGPCPRPVARFTLAPEVEPMFQLTRCK